MKTMLALLIAVAGCGPKAIPEPMDEARPVPEPYHLNRVQLACRSEDPIAVRSGVNALDRGCARDISALALTLIDEGALDGQAEAMNQTFAEIGVCICAVPGACTEKQFTDMANKAKFVMVDNANVAKSAGVSRTIERIASNSCVDRLTAGSLYRLGFDCGYIETKRGPETEAQWGKVMFGSDAAQAQIAKCRNL